MGEWLTNGLIDMLILGLLGWMGAIGWHRGGVRSLIDSVSLGTSAAVVVLSIPFIKDALIDGWWALRFRNWIEEHLIAVPAGIGIATGGSGIAERFYHLLIAGAGAVAVWIGMQMILQVFQTVWAVPRSHLTSRLFGLGIGVGIGGIFSWYMVQWLGLLSWLQGFEALDAYLGQSFFVWIIMNYAAM